MKLQIFTTGEIDGRKMSYTLTDISMDETSKAIDVMKAVSSKFDKKKTIKKSWKN